MVSRVMHRVLYVFVLVFSGSIPLFAQADHAFSYRVERVIIDAGHGGKDPGALGRFTKEKDIALKIALKLGEIIATNLPDVEVIYTRKKDTYLTLHERAMVANEANADVFISIHCNWISKPSIHGTETYVMGLHKSEEHFEVAKRENSVILLEENADEVYQGFDPSSPESYILFSLNQSAHVHNSLDLAARVEEQFKTRAQRKSWGVKMAGFWVLWETSMPSILVETGYLSNSREERMLNSATQQSYIASAIFRAFRDYKDNLEGMSRN